MPFCPLNPPVIGRSYRLTGGLRIRLRMLQPRDSAAIQAFLAEQGLGIDALELARMVRFDPRQRAVICASALVNSREVVLALGGIDLHAPEPDLIVTAADTPTALRELLVDALCGRAHARAA